VFHGAKFSESSSEPHYILNYSIIGLCGALALIAGAAELKGIVLDAWTLTEEKGIVVPGWLVPHCSWPWTAEPCIVLA